MNWQRIRHIVKKEFIQIRRDPRMFRMIIIVPIFQLIVFGYGINTDVRNNPTVLLDSDRTSQSRNLIARFENSGYFNLKYYAASPRELSDRISRGDASVGIEIPTGFAKDLSLGKSADLQVIVDGTDSTTAGLVMGYVGGIVKRFSEDVVSDRALRIGAKLSSLPGVDDRTRVWYNPDLKSVNFMVPGVLCLILLIVTMIMTSMAIVKEREIGTLEQLIVTPIKSRELMIGKVIPFVLIGFVDVFLILLVARFWFSVSIAGSALLLFALTAVFLMTSLGTGLFISTVSRNQQQAMMTSFFITMPSILLSGFMFPIENMPRIIQYITYALPLRYFLTIVRGIFLKGSGMAVLWPQVLALLAFGIIILNLSSMRFAKKLG